MHKKILFLILIVLFLIPAFTDATILTIKGKLGYNLTINVLNSLNNESSISSPILVDIGNSGQTNVEFSSGTAKVNIIVMARVNGKIAKKKELYNLNVQTTTTPIIVDLLETPVPAPKPAPTPSPSPTIIPTPSPSSTINQSPSQVQSPTEQTPAKEANQGKRSLLSGLAIDPGSINLSSTAKKIIIYSVIGVIVLILVIFLIIFLVKRKRKGKIKPNVDFKVTKLSHLKESEPEDIEEAEKRLRVAREEIDRINEILNKRRAIKEAELKLDEERRTLERLKKGFR